MTARIVLINGVSSVGKGSVAKALQKIASRPMLHVQMDAFLEMLPAACSARRRAACSRPPSRTASP
jgi:chloramphenicol 3-O phosphotransferase